jgi:RimJ/RimL family protein N-acetyltransferase
LFHCAVAGEEVGVLFFMEKEIRGKRIILREQREEDVPYYTYWFNQPKVMFQCGFERTCTEEDVKRSITVNHKSEDSLWYTITDFDGNIIGETGLLRMFPAWHQTDLTIIIPDPDMQSKGYGTEAIRIMLDMAFKDLGMHRVSIGVVGLNTGALRFYERIGFKKEGIFEEAYYYNNEYSDFVMMRILEQEWV